MYIETYRSKYNRISNISGLDFKSNDLKSKTIITQIKDRLFLINNLFKRKKELMDFEKDYTAFLSAFASSLNSGTDYLTAFINTGEIFPVSSGIYKEIKLLKENIENGASENEVIISFANKYNNEDIQNLRIALLISKSEGSSLSTILGRLIKIKRQKESFQRKIKTGLVMQKLSAIGIIICLILILLSQFIVNSKAVINALQHPLGFKMVSLGFFLIITGIFWMIKISRLKF